MSGCPVYKVTERGLTAKEILNICVLEDVPPRKVCHTVPQKVQETAMFVIDLQDVDERDLTADGNGIYKRQSSPTELVTAEVESSRIRSVKKLAKKMVRRIILHLRLNGTTAGILHLKNFVALLSNYEKKRQPLL